MSIGFSELDRMVVRYFLSNRSYAFAAVSSARINRDGVHARRQITQGCVNRAVAGDAGHWGQGLGADGDRNYLELEAA